MPPAEFMLELNSHCGGSERPTSRKRLSHESVTLMGGISNCSRARGPRVTSFLSLCSPLCEEVAVKCGGDARPHLSLRLPPSCTS